MRRRELMGTGLGMLATPVGATTRAQNTVERVVSETHGMPGLTTGLSPSGDIVLFGFDDGDVLVYDADRDGTVIPISVDRSVSHIAVRDATTTAVLGWMDADRFAHLDLAAVEGTFVEHAGLWDLATTPDAGRTASVSSPAAMPGSVRLADNDGTVLWETPFGNAIGQSVAVADDGTHIAVGAGRYWADGTDPTGQPGIRLYDATGTERWRHDHAADVLVVGVDVERELVVAGTDDGHTIVLDFDGQVVWETAAVGGWLVLSADGGTIITADAEGTLYALDAPTGNDRWTADIGMWPADDLSVAADGSRAFAADRSAAEFVVVEDGEPIWTASHDVGPGRGAIAADGRTWSTIVTDLDAETARVAVYRTPDAVAEPEPAPPREEPPDDEGPSDEKDGEDGDGPGDPAALELTDYHILGERASEEYITLRNTGDRPLELAGWTIRDRREDGRVGTNASPFEFPPGFTLEPGADVTIYTGEGEPTAETLYWEYSGDFQIWQEEGDVVIVRDAAGDIILEESIGNENGGPSDPAALVLADYHILGERASEEYITLRNGGERPLDMPNWSIEDTHRIPANNASLFLFPSGFTLEPGATVMIVTGSGSDTAETLYWGYEGDFQIWNEEGDVVIVRDASGAVVLEQEIAANQEPDPPADDEPDEPADPPDDAEPDEPADPPGDEETNESDEPPATESDEPADPSDEPTDPPDDNETDEPAEPPSDEPTDEPADPPSDDGPDEPTDPPDEERDQSADPPAEPTDEPSNQPANQPADADTADSPAKSAGADGDEPNTTDAA